jgi:hypothetical protein
LGAHYLDCEPLYLSDRRLVDFLSLAQSARMELLSFRIRPYLPTILYLASMLLFPREGSIDESVDYKTHYYANHRAFFAIFSMFTVVDVIDSLLKGIPHFLALGMPYIISSALYFAGMVTAAVTRNERYHQFYALFFLTQTIVISLILFQTLV